MGELKLCVHKPTHAKVKLQEAGFKTVCLSGFEVCVAKYHDLSVTFNFIYFIQWLPI